MEAREAMTRRHSVRQYTDRPLDGDVLAALQAETEACSREGGLHLQLITDEPRAFSGPMAHYGKFRGVRNYFALVGRKGETLEERCGYYGQHLVLTAQTLGLNTCWVALTYRKIPGAVEIGPGEKLAAVIAVGYGETQGAAHRSKPAEAVSGGEQPLPDWFRAGVEAALLAPTAMNQQKFTLTHLGGGAVAAKAGRGPCTAMDLGIVKYQFELGAGRENFRWS